MNNPVIYAFFIGRALAEVIGEKLEDAVTNAMSEIGKFDAETRENLRQFTEEVMRRAQSQAENETSQGSSSYSTGSNISNTSLENSTGGDLQETIDELRAEIARLKTELKKYRS